jgi:hypothetical protein
MTALPLVGGVTVFLVVVLLLLSLNLASLWRWWIKGIAIVVSIAMVVVLYLAFTAIIGWPSLDRPPSRFNLLYTRIVEPDHQRSTPGHVYLWVEEVDEHQVIISPPRAFEVPYTVQTATDVATAQKQLDGGGKVLGQFAADQPDQGTRPATPEQAGSGKVNEEGLNTDHPSNGGGEGFENTGDPAALSFSDMPPVDLPEKSDVTMVGD